MTERKRVLLIGPGAVGGTGAAWLIHVGHDVTLGVRTRFDQLRVETPDEVLESTPKIIGDPREAGDPDWVLVVIKTYDLETADGWLRVLAGERTLFAETAIAVTEVDDFTTALWRKLCINVAGAMSALTDEPASVAWRASAAEVMRALVRECIPVGRAEGARLDDSVADAVVKHYRTVPPDSLNSLHGDRRAGRPMEWDARNGVVSRLGREHSIATPVSDTVSALLSAIKERIATREPIPCS